MAANKFRHQEASDKSFYIGLLSSRDVHEKKRDNFVFIVANSLPKRRSLVVKPLWFSIAPYKNKNNTEGRKNKVWFLFYFSLYCCVCVTKQQIYAMESSLTLLRIGRRFPPGDIETVCQSHNRVTRPTRKSRKKNFNSISRC